MRVHVLIATAAMLSFSQIARADTFNFTVSGPDTASGVITASATGTPGEYIVGSITGMVDGLNITGLLGLNSYAGNDNLLFYPATGSTFVDDNGISFLLSNGFDGNLFYGQISNGNVGYYIAQGSGGNQTVESATSDNVSVVPTPEPSSLLLLGTGLLGFAGAVRRKLLPSR